tara:strand:+ start:382 stop:792 length:411 start_codon:yes stop_codon:yes gene_type:complete
MLPLELIEYILLKVKDKKTILSLRLTNKHFYNIFKDVIDYEKEKKYVFNKKSYQTFNLKTKTLENDIVFKYPCYYIYKEYGKNSIVKKKIESSLFEIEKTDFIFHQGFKRILYNSYSEKTKETTVNYPMLNNCTLM